MTLYATGYALRLDQTGTVFKIGFVDGDGVARDISGASLVQLKFRKPDGTVLTETAAFTDDGVDGFAQFTDSDGDMTDTEGTWKYWGVVTFGATRVFPSTTLRYKVEAEGEG